MFCAKCGAELLEDAIFCAKCGAKRIDLPEDNLTPKNESIHSAPTGDSSKKQHLYAEIDNAIQKNKSSQSDSFVKKEASPSSNSFSSTDSNGQINVAESTDKRSAQRKTGVVVVVALVLIGIVIGALFGIRASNGKNVIETVQQFCWNDATENITEPIQKSYLDDFGINVFVDGFGAPSDFIVHGDSKNDSIYYAESCVCAIDEQTGEEFNVIIDYVVEVNFLRSRCSLVEPPALKIDLPTNDSFTSNNPPVEGTTAPTENETADSAATPTAPPSSNFSAYAGEYVLHSEFPVRVIVEDMQDNEHLRFYYYYDGILEGEVYAYLVYPESKEADAQFYAETVASESLQEFLGEAIFMINSQGYLTISSGEVYDCLLKNQ